MRSITALSLRVAAILGGSAIIGASVAAYPAAAQDVNSMLIAFGITTCSSANPCKEFKNNGTGAGVEGVGNNGNGVVAMSTNGSALFASSTSADGMQSVSKQNDGTNSSTTNPSGSDFTGRSGVWGHDDSTDGGTLNVGVAGSSTNGTGISGSSTNGFGVNAASTNNLGLFASSTNSAAIEGVSPAANARALFIYATNSGADGADINGGYIGIIGRAPANSGLYPLVLTDSNGTDLDYTDTSGDFFYHGSLIGFSRTHNGNTVWSYAAKSASPSIEDTGSAQLVNGTATVRLDPAFAQAIDTGRPYHVMLTPDGDTRGLFVASKTPTGFVVREVQGGTGTLTFDYHIYAPTLGQANQRMTVTSNAQATAIMPKALPVKRTR